LERTIQVRVDDKPSETKNMEMGTPQGRVLSPLLFLIMAADFPETDGIKKSPFADDSAVWKCGRNIIHWRESLQRQLYNIVKWCDTWGFIVNAKKKSLFHSHDELVIELRIRTLS
jgi:ribonucleases P/MRP protein subunit RPP40